VDQNQSNNGKSEKLKELWLGIGISLAIYLLGLLILFVYSAFLLPYMGIAVIALIFIPIVCFSLGKKRMGQGALIGLGLNILLFTACSGIILYNLGG
jgi:Ca2+-dependent lipid-binding protein